MLTTIEKMKLAKEITSKAIKKSPEIQEILNQLQRLRELEKSLESWKFDIIKTETEIKKNQGDRLKELMIALKELNRRKDESQGNLKKYKQETNNFKSSDEILSEILNNLIKQNICKN